MDVDTPVQQEASVSFDVTAAGSEEVSLRTAEIRRNLKMAVEELSHHGLKLAAKWAAEQLVGLPDETADEQQQIGGCGDAFEDEGTTKVDPWLEGRTVFAKTLMDVGEFERASKALGDKPIQVPIAAGGSEGARASLPSRARFIRWYSLYLAGERRREEESQLTDALQRRRLVNPFLPSLLSQLSECDAEGSLDAFGLFMYGAVLKASRGEGRGHGADIPASSSPSAVSLSGFTTPMKFHKTSKSPSSRRESKEGIKGRRPLPGKGDVSRMGMRLGSAGKALSLLERSLRMFPYNWSAWLDLATLCLETDSVPETLEADPPCPWMFQFFLQHLLVEQHRSKDAMAILGHLQTTFPNSSYVLSQNAVAQYHQRNFDQGHEDFKELRRRDPLRLDSLDVFSNILYVKECKAELSFLAHTTVKSAPLRPETNCIIGNYYSLKGQHEKAVVYFLKALRLDRRCLSAWTLMGHEFVELKNSGAAIESYRQAVDINPKDYRAWYGLGQAYEILQMHLYATYYYRRATALRPYDARMWIAMGNCFEKLERRGEAISAFERAMANEDQEGVALERLAKLYSAEGRDDEAAKCYETMLNKASGNRDINATSAEEAMLFLCYYYKSKGDFNRTSTFANGLLDHTGTSREEALAVLREIRSTQEARQQARNASSNTGGRSFMTPHSGRRGSTAGRDRTSGLRMRGAGGAATPGGTPSMLSRSALGGGDMSMSMSIVSDGGDSGGMGSSRGGGVSGYRDAEDAEGDGESASDILSP